ncbi:hypothetical protein GGX14DRAFT_608843 [Mycena pura]|uniref:Uncharacterized protein n=1 Tax=Mycena pura TaxID=153505 RepID=A0AAD6UNQ8_9AGAR|nr:hypothetical protein GGX14DRAFT_608843 [Mycena pura]
MRIAVAGRAVIRKVEPVLPATRARSTAHPQALHIHLLRPVHSASASDPQRATPRARPFPACARDLTPAAVCPRQRPAIAASLSPTARAQDAHYPPPAARLPPHCAARCTPATRRTDPSNAYAGACRTHPRRAILAAYCARQPHALRTCPFPIHSLPAACYPPPALLVRVSPPTGRRSPVVSRTRASLFFTLPATSSAHVTAVANSRLAFHRRWTNHEKGRRPVQADVRAHAKPRRNNVPLLPMTPLVLGVNRGVFETLDGVGLNVALDIENHHARVRAELPKSVIDAGNLVIKSGKEFCDHPPHTSIAEDHIVFLDIVKAGSVHSSSTDTREKLEICLKSGPTSIPDGVQINEWLGKGMHLSSFNSLVPGALRTPRSSLCLTQYTSCSARLTARASGSSAACSTTVLHNYETCGRCEVPPLLHSHSHSLPHYPPSSTEHSRLTRSTPPFRASFALYPPLRAHAFKRPQLAASVIDFGVSLLKRPIYEVSISRSRRRQGIREYAARFASAARALIYPFQDQGYGTALLRLQLLSVGFADAVDNSLPRSSLQEREDEKHATATGAVALMGTDPHFDVQKDTVLELSRRDMISYREFAFPASIAQPDHDPFFSLENPSSWITAMGWELFKWQESMRTEVDMDEICHTQLLEFREMIVAPQYLEHKFFSLNNTQEWVRLGAFANYAIYKAPGPSCSPGLRSHSSPTSSHAASVHWSRPPSRSQSRASGFYRRSPSARLSPDPLLSTTATPDVPETTVPASGDELRPDRPRGRTLYKGKGKAKAHRSGTRIHISREHSVGQIIPLTSAPSTWTVNNDAAYRLDLSASTHLFTAKPEAKHPMSIQRLIKREASLDQDSWKASGGGHKGGDTTVYGFSEDFSISVRAKHIHHHCNGVHICELVPEELFADCERYEPDPDAMLELWHHVLDANEKEANSVGSI